MAPQLNIAGGNTVIPYSISMHGSREALLAFILELIENDELLRSTQLESISINGSGGGVSYTEYDPYILSLGLNVQTWPEEK